MCVDVPVGVVTSGRYAHPVARARARQMSPIVSPRTSPTRRTIRDRATSWALSRFATDGVGTPSSSPTATSVETPRTLDVTGATITAFR